MSAIVTNNKQNTRSCDWTSMKKSQIGIFMCKTEINLRKYYAAGVLDQGLMHGERRCRWSVPIQFCYAAGNWITHDFGRIPGTRICSIVLGIVQALQHACDRISCRKLEKNSQPKNTKLHPTWAAGLSVQLRSSSSSSSSSGHMKLLHENVVRTSCIANII
jgi:hypothetical protein